VETSLSAEFTDMVGTEMLFIGNHFSSFGFWEAVPGGRTSDVEYRINKHKSTTYINTCPQY